jgi:quinol monooxygenase YgiN
MYLSLIRIYPSPGNEHTVIDVLDSLRGPITAKVDCLICTVMVETDGTGAICYSEQWRTREAQEQHLRSALFGRVLEAMEWSCRPPKVEFYEVNAVGGLERVEQVRMTNATQ